MSRTTREVAVQHLLMAIAVGDVALIIATDGLTFTAFFDGEEPDKWHVTGYDDELGRTYSPDVHAQLVANYITELGALGSVEFTLVTRKSNVPT